MAENNQSSSPDADSGNRVHAGARKPARRKRNKIFRYLRRAIRERKAKKQTESSADRATRRTANATALMAFFTLILALISLETFFILQSQLSEMKKGGIDTHTLAQQAVTQATQTTNLAIAAGTQATAASSFAISAGQINEEIEKAEKDFFAMAGNSKAAIKATQEQMRQDQRAWVGVGSPSFVINATDPIKTETHVVVLGKSPAVDITTRMGLRPFPPTYILQLGDIVLDSKEIHNGTGFPGTSFPVRETVKVPLPKQGEFVGDIGQKYILYFFGEIRYRDIFNAAHWTHFCYAISGTQSADKDGAPCDIYNDSDADGKAKLQNPK